MAVHPPRRRLHFPAGSPLRILRRIPFLRILLLIGNSIFPTEALAEAIPTAEERLGPWHYLYPLEYFKGGDVRHSRYVSVPTVVAFGAARDRIACLLPGSKKLVEFKGGRFEDLHLPEEWAALSLAADQAGTLFCLVQHTGAFLKPANEWKKRWAIEMTAAEWKPAVAIPYPGCDRLEFDSENRFWALGVGPIVGFLKSGTWTTFTYSNDSHLGFLPLRIAEDHGEVTLFSWEERPSFGGVSRMPGTLSFREGDFHRDAKAPTAKWNEAENRRTRERTDDTVFPRATGYVTHAKALNAQYNGPRTVLRAAGFVVVSLGIEGLVWADAAELEHAAPLPANEWEEVRNVTASPRPDSKGDLWMGRGRNVIVVRADKADSMLGELPEGKDFTIDFDPLDRPWIMNWHGSFEGPVTVCADGKLARHRDLATALQSEAASFKPGRIFPFAIKTPDGAMAFGGGYFDTCSVLDSKGAHSFIARQIDPNQRPPRTGHGYNPFRGGEPWFNRHGQILTRVDGNPFLFESRKNRWIAASENAAGDTDLPPPPDDPPDFTGPFEGRVKTTDGRTFVFKGFHFYSVDHGEKRQLDFGVNPLAYYPFWSGWYRSPGMTRPQVGPSGRIWISSLGPYAENREWWVLRKPAPQAISN